MNFCPECGTALNGAKFCPQCGAKIGVESSAEPAPVDVESEVWRGSPDAVLSPVAAHSTTYVLTTERLRIETGKLRKKAETIELFRVRDVTLHQSLPQRGRGCGDLWIRSTDRSTPTVKLQAVAHPEEVAEKIRSLLSEARRRHGVTTIEYS